ncbi:MAG: hypothetical protein WC515_07270 [Candidatus Omnitrophota bacterium]
MARVKDAAANKVPVKREGREKFPRVMKLELEKVYDVYMGENHHQKAALYRDPSSNGTGICDARKLRGREVSSNILIDANTAIEMIKVFDLPTVIFVKHTNPCGASSADSISAAFTEALDCDRQGLFGTTVVVNGRVDRALAGLIMDETRSVRIESVIAPYFDRDTIDIFSAKDDLVMFELPKLKDGSDKEMDYKKVIGGFLVQDTDLKLIGEKGLQVVTKRAPSAEEESSLIFGNKIAKYTKSNAIVISKGTKTVGIATGQILREEAAAIALRKAGERARGATMASDARFSRADSIEYAHEAGITAIIHQGGDKADPRIIETCDRYGMSMVTTGCRHFKH